MSAMLEERSIRRGLVLGEQNALLSQLRTKVGGVSEDVEAAVRALHSPEEIEPYLRRILFADGIEEMGLPRRGASGAHSADRMMARYHLLADKQHRQGLTDDEERELAQIRSALQQEEEPLRRAIKARSTQEHERHLEEMTNLEQLGRRLDSLLQRLGAGSPDATPAGNEQ